METSQGIVRPNYFEGRLLSAEDLRTEQAYHRRMRHLHNRAFHGSGIVSGLEVDGSGATVRVAPGLAVDGLGREILLEEEQSLVLPAGDQAVVLLCLGYDEEEIDPVLTAQGDSSPSRIAERHALRIDGSSEDPACVPLALLEVRDGALVDIDPAVRSRAAAVPPMLTVIERLADRVRRVAERVERLADRVDRLERRTGGAAGG